MTLQLKVPRTEFAYVTSRTPAEIKMLRPSEVCAKGKAKEAQSDTYQQAQKLKAQTMRREGDTIILTERYAPPKSGFPGRLCSFGSQNMWRPIRSLLFKDMAELDQARSVHRIVKYVADTVGVRTPFLAHYLEHHDECIRNAMIAEGCDKGKAKLLFNLAWTTDAPLQWIKDDFLKSFDREAKAVREKLMQVEALDWIVQAANGAGSFMTKLTHFVETKLSASVLHALQEHGVHVHAWVFDGLYIDRSHYQSVELQELAHEACEAVAPGINMTWGWKLPDPTVYDLDGRAVHTLSVPDDFVPAPSRWNEWDPETQPTYDDFQDPREGREDTTYPGLYTLFSQTHCKVGAAFVDSDKQPGKYTFPDEARLIKEYKHRVTFAPPEIATDEDGQEYLQAGVKQPNFINLWLKDHRMDPLYLKDKTGGNYWKYFDCFPDDTDCPEGCFNTWRGFAAEDLDAIDWGTEDTTARECLAMYLGHIKMLCNSKVQYDFLLDLLAQSAQYPQNKLGIMICLVGPKGCGKTILWSLIMAVFGEGACFETEKPDLDIWGDNNSCIMGKFFLRIMEAKKKGFKDHIEAARAKITDPTIRVRALYGAADNIKSYHRFYLDTNNEDAIPDEHDERRFFIVKCSDAMIGQHGYFEELANAIKSPAGVRAFYEFLMARPCKPHYMGKDIPVGEFARKLKDHNRTHGDLFVQAIVEDQRIDQVTITWSVDEVYNFYTRWQSGSEYSRSKSAVIKLLELGSIEGIQLIRPIDKLTKKQYRAYTLDLAALRKRYGIDRAIEAEKRAEVVRAGGSAMLADMAAGVAPAAPLPGIDVDADIDAFLEPPSPPSKRQRI